MRLLRRPGLLRVAVVSGTLAFTLVAILVFLLTQPFVAPVPSQPTLVDAARLQAHVRYLSTELYPRSFDQFRKLDRAATYIAEEFRAAGGVVSTQEVVVDETRYRNVRVRFGPVQGPLLVIGAHYDSHADADAEVGDSRGYSSATHTPGADDNASGVAGLIELAHLLGRAPQQRPIELVAYTLEEPPHFRTEHMGSAWHARSLAEERREVRLMLSLEMIGYFSDAAASQSYPVPGMTAFYPDQGNFIALVGRWGDFLQTRRAKAVMAGSTSLPVHSINAPSIVPGVDFSDHRSYWHEDFPALMVTDTAFYRNPNYHAGGDTHDKLDYRRMANVVQAVYALAQQL